MSRQTIEINKAEWIPAIKKEIAKWEGFYSIFGKQPEDKQVDELRKFLALVETNTLTREQFEHFLYSYFW